MEFRRIDELPPYTLATVEGLKLELRRAGHDVVDLGFGNPDIPSPAVAVWKLAEAASKSRNHRYSASRGLPSLRRAGHDVVDLGFGNPDIPSPPLAVEKLQEAAAKDRNHRYSSSRGLPNLRLAICSHYRRR